MRIVIIVLVLAVAAYCLVRRRWTMRAATPVQPDPRASTPNAADTGPVPDIHRWTALDDRQLIRLLNESAP